MNEIEKAKAILREAGYFVDNLWTVQDVQDRYKCDCPHCNTIIAECDCSDYLYVGLEYTEEFNDSQS